MTPRDRRPLGPGRQALAASYVPFARALARPYKLAWPALRAEFESAAMLGLVEAAEAFDPSRGVRFPTFARHRIAGALRDAMRRELPLGYRSDPSAAPEVRGLAPGAEPAGSRVLGASAAPPVGADVDEADAFEARIAGLDAAGRYIARGFYRRLGRTRRELARHLGISASRLWAMHRAALDELARGTPPGPGPDANGDDEASPETSP